MADVTEYNLKTKKVTERAYTAEERADFARIKSEHKPTYKERRQAEYPPVTDQLDAIMKWLAASEFHLPKELSDLVSKCMAVKEKYPKDGNTPA